jgi:membrane fusion protein, multidrug efflux system
VRTADMRLLHGFLAIMLAGALAAGVPARAQQAPPPAVGVIKVARQPVTQSSEYVGRIAAPERVNLVARVTAFIDKRFYTEGAEVKAGDLLYRLEQPPFEADVEAKQAAIANVEAQLQNANLTLSRAKALLHTPAGQQSVVDAAVAGQQSLAAQLLAAKAQLKQSQINLDYTEIRAPIDGKIGRTTVTEGNVVSPSSGVLATIVSQDPMYVVFPVSVRAVLDLRQRYEQHNGGWTHAVVVRIRLPNGRLFDRTAALDFVNNTIAANTDTIMLRAVVANPLQAEGKGDGAERALVDGELVTVLLEEAQPVEALTIPRAAVLTDLGGDYVYVVDAGNRAHQQRVTLGQSTPTMAVVLNGLAEGDSVIVDGIQRVRPGQAVSPSPAASQAGAGGSGAISSSSRS